MSKFNKLSAVIAALSLSACMASQPLGDPPSQSEIDRVARLAHQKTYGKPPTALQIGQLHRVPMFFDSEEYMVCVSTQERTLGPVFDNSGNQLAAEGTSFRQSHALHLKLYNDGWGSGIYRRFESRKIGQVLISDYCPGSVNSW